MFFWLTVILFVLMILIGEERGVSSVLTLIGNVIGLIFCISLIRSGMQVFFAVFLCGILFAMLTLFVQNGINRKTVSALVSVLVVMLGLMFFMAWLLRSAHLGGYSEIEIQSDIPAFMNNKVNISAYEVMTAVVLFGLLGAIMDTALAISTAVYEVYQNNRELGFAELFKSGGRVGRDILGTTVNTLFFAGIGESLLLFMMFVRQNYGVVQLLNSKAFVQQLFVIAFSNIGCMMIIPVASVIVAKVLSGISPVSHPSHS